jgi:hypothetical protein
MQNRATEGNPYFFDYRNSVLSGTGVSRERVDKESVHRLTLMKRSHAERIVDVLRQLDGRRHNGHGTARSTTPALLQLMLKHGAVLTFDH